MRHIKVRDLQVSAEIHGPSTLSSLPPGTPRSE